MHTRYPLVLWTMLLIMAGCAVTESLYGHPGFARKYRMSCTTCHNPPPRLKEFGDEYAGNAFTLEGQEPSRYHIDTGDDMLLLQALPPIGFRMDAYIRYLPNSEDTKMTNDFQTPYGIKFLSGGRLAQKVAYYFYFYLSEQGEIAGVEDAYLYFADFLGTPVGFTIGQFQVSDPMYKRELRLTIEDYILYKTRISPSVPVDLTYDRGVMFNYTAPWGSDFFLEILSGNGIGESVAGLFDQDSFKNLALRWSHSISKVRLGAFGYYGQTGLENDETNITRIYGPDATVEAGPVELNMQYLWRTDNNPFPGASSTTSAIRTNGSLMEAIFAPQGDRSHWYLIGLFNYRTSNVRDYFAGAPQLEYQSAGLTWTYLLARNLRLSLEYNRDIYNKRNRFTMGFFSAF